VPGPPRPLARFTPTRATFPAAPAFPLGCEHYRRKCQLLAPCCGQWYPCRICHDDREDDGQRDVKRKHKLDRRMVQRVRCCVCGLEQAPQQACSGCSATMGAYYCAICRLFDDTDKGQYHCEQCGICRVGGRANFRHCDKCRTCLAASTFDAHSCREDASDLRQSQPRRCLQP